VRVLISSLLEHRRENEPLSFRPLITPLMVAIIQALAGGETLAQAAFPAPPPGQGIPAAPQPQAGASDECVKGFIPLREEVEKRGKLIKAASERRAPPDEACKLIANFSHAEVKMIKYIEANVTKCGTPTQIADQLKSGHKNTEALEKKVCMIAEQIRKHGPSGPSLSEVLGSSSPPPSRGPTGDFPPYYR
jgi:hypothetical protein